MVFTEAMKTVGEYADGELIIDGFKTESWKKINDRKKTICEKRQCMCG